MIDKGQAPILLAGQTASGKSGLALEIAQKTDGIIINADSMQVYDGLQILSARPTIDEMQGIPHKLYGHVNANTPYSVGLWLTDVEKTLQWVSAKGKRAIIVGGTGLYFKGLLQGLSPVPDIDEEIREKWRLKALSPDSDLHSELLQMDPQMAKRLQPGDRQRLARALEVMESTGKSLSFWQQQPMADALLDPDRTLKLVIEIKRAKLYARCDHRFDLMMQAGAVEEVRSLLKARLPPTLPAMRALGVRPLAQLLKGKISRQDAVERAKTETRQYAKRQSTWIKSNMITWKRINLKHSHSYLRDILSLV